MAEHIALIQSLGRRRVLGWKESGDVHHKTQTTPARGTFPYKSSKVPLCHQCLKRAPQNQMLMREVDFAMLF